MPIPLRPLRRPSTLALLAACLWIAPAGAETRHAVDPDTGAETWETRAHGVALSLTQILPDQARAFYLNRGLPAAAAEGYATSCVYMTVLRNETAPGEIRFRLADWRSRAGGEERPPLTADDWLARWADAGLSEPARIAFRWAQFPTEQEYAPGEWNQGMLSTGLPPGARFDLIAHWSWADKQLEGRLENVRCAP